MQLPRHLWKSEEALGCIRGGKPVVLLECPIICPAYANWDLQSIASMIKDDFLCDVYVSKSRRFPYWDQTKNTYNYCFEPLTKKESMTFEKFLQKRQLSEEYYYLQQTLVSEMGPVILQEYTKFSLSTTELFKVIAGWRELSQNLLLCGSEGFITPLHFDEQENLFSQLQGCKRVRLFSPDYWYALYPFPMGHPQDRQCQIELPQVPGTPDFESEDMRYRFPAFKDAACCEMFVDLQPGEILYVPPFWFHQMEALTDNVSVTWWFKHQRRSDIDYNNLRVSDIPLTVVRRNIGKFFVLFMDSS